jgi:NADH:ubiquinone oxidoreductase subunit
MNIGTWLFTRLNGRQFGTDEYGNIYYEEKRPRPGSLRSRRWVMYAGPPEASSVPPEWHATRRSSGHSGGPGRSRICRIRLARP